MDAHARAGIEIHGKVMRYAEVEHYGPHYRLLRLGSCDFEFDAGAEVLTAENPTHMQTVADAVKDVFDKCIATDLHIALHPPSCYSFFTPLSSTDGVSTRKEQLRKETALLTGPETASALHLTVDPASLEAQAEVGRDWYHILGMPEHLHTRFLHILEALPIYTYRPRISMQAAARVVERVERAAGYRGRLQAPYTLAIGWYQTHLEYVLCREGQWCFCHFTEPGAAVDAAYFSVSLLDRLRIPVEAVGRLFVYGSPVDLSELVLLQGVFGFEPERLNPVPSADLDPAGVAGSFDVEAYVPCIGVAL